MSIIYLQDFGLFGKILQYNTITGEAKYATLPDGIERSRGYFLDTDNQFIGLHASLEGPIFFWKDDRVNLVKEKVNIEIDDISGSKRKLCIVSVNDAERLRITYEPDIIIAGLGVIPEDEADFLVWLKTSKDDEWSKSFIEAYTVAPDTPA